MRPTPQSTVQKEPQAVGDEQRQALYSRPPRFASLLAAIRVVSEPANLAMLPAILGSLVVVTADTSPRLAIVLTLTAVLLIIARLRHAVTISALLLAGFAAAAMLHAAAVTVAPPQPPSHHGA
jgi:hypothetical protein